MNVVFVLHGSVDSNSGYHVQAYARVLTDLGVRCAITYYPDQPESEGQVDCLGVPVLSFTAALAGPLHASGGVSDIVHAWTPREHVRRFCCSLYAREQPLKTVIHLEDNEVYLSEKVSGLKAEELRGFSDVELDEVVPGHLFHLGRGRRWLERADGLTMIVPELQRLNYGDAPSIVLPPLIDAEVFRRRPLNRELRRSLGISDQTLVVVYTGNSHFANRAEVRSLYVAVALLNRAGISAVVVRTGRDAKPLVQGDQSWLTSLERHLGMVERPQIPEVLATADIFVQPGLPGDFNDLRLPSKLPEFFAIGRPVVLPRSNVGLTLRHREDAYLLDRADALSLFRALKDIWQDRNLRHELTEGAVRVAKRWTDVEDGGLRLKRFYEELLA
jgi:glycosyltransferase involved in cell wall biosynthesis